MKPNPRLTARIALDLIRRRWAEQGRGSADRDFFPIDVEWVITNYLGWKLEITDQSTLDPFDPMAQDVALTDFESRLVRVARSENEGRLRWTLAHEAGHIIMHEERAHGRKLHRSQRDNESLVRKLERETGTFATEFLMPEPQLRSVFNECVGSRTIRLDAAFSLLKKGPRELEGKMKRGDTLFDVVCREVAGFRFPELGTISGYFGLNKEPMGYRLSELGIVLISGTQT